jgi:hypothetical protein
MRTLLIQLIEPGDPPRQDPTVARADWVKEWILQGNEWGFDEVVLMADDCMRHPDIWDIVDYSRNKVSQTLVFTNGQWLTRDQNREFHMRDERPRGDVDIQRSVKPVIPVHFDDPIMGDVTYGWWDLNEKMQQAMQMLPDPEVWQSLTDPQIVQNTVNMSQQMDADWRGHVTDETPEELIEQLQDMELPLLPPDNWLFCHSEVGVPDIDFYQREIVQNRQPFTGTLHIDHKGMMRSLRTETERGMTWTERDDLTDWAFSPPEENRSTQTVR